MIRSSMLFAAAFTILIFQPGYAQSKSAVQFYDTTGTSKTGKIGWSGDATSGHLFLQTLADGEVLKTKPGGIEVTGTLSATSIAGDGSGLTNLPSQQITVGSVNGLQDSLNRKATTTDLLNMQTQVGARADTTWVKNRMIIKADTSWVNGKLSIKADTTWVNTKIANIGTAQIPDGAVTTAKIADTAVTGAKIRDRAVTDAKIDSVSWAKVKGKPATYPAESHSHAQSQVDGLTDSLTAHRTLINGKANASHTHAQSQVTGLPDSLTAHRNLIAAKANSADVYTKSQVDGIIGGDSAMYQREATTALRVSNTTPTSYKSLTITAPSDGYVIVSATASMSPWGLTNFCVIVGAISQNSTSSEIYNHALSWIAGNQEARIFAMTRMFQVSAGDNTFYLKFWKANDGVNTYEDGQIDSINLTAIFVKTVL
ncbi:MAG: hypothetical protein JW768_12865 [Chitinispirillaceae bacterium]|nr:hypothetical protein [Chitinispirillaceae bacterium]